MRHSLDRPRAAQGWVCAGTVVAVVVFGLGLPLEAGERRPHTQQPTQTPETRHAVPRTSSEQSGSTRAQAPPTARDTRQIPPEQYRRPPAGGKPPGGGHPPSGSGGHWGGGYPYRHHGPYYHPYWWWGWGWGWGWRVPYWYPYWYGSPYGVYPTPSYQVRHVATDLGGLDLNVKPKKAAVYVDGEYVGLAKEFDGYPGYLWLRMGVYRVTLFMPGYKTLTHSFEIRSGEVFDVRIRLEPGEATPPELPPAAEPQRPTMASETTAKTSQEAPGETGRLQFLIQPADASVYLDGRFLGSAVELGSLHAGLIVGAGRHQVEVVRPGYTPEELDVFVEPDGELDLRVDLSQDSSR